MTQSTTVFVTSLPFGKVVTDNSDVVVTAALALVTKVALSVTTSGADGEGLTASFDSSSSGTKLLPSEELAGAELSALDDKEDATGDGVATAVEVPTLLVSVSDVLPAEEDTAALVSPVPHPETRLFPGNAVKFPVITSSIGDAV